MGTDYIKKLDLKIGDEVVYATKEDEPWKEMHGFYMIQGLKKDKWLRNFNGTCKLSLRFEDDKDISPRNLKKLLKRRDKLTIRVQT